jgi:hypothetical protein
MAGDNIQAVGQDGKDGNGNQDGDNVTAHGGVQSKTGSTELT